ncbi:hypothetical protein Noda2021_09000 [Candidatus Dependentiae bacterium Noda2021]|nr:hypothetical protein Noda2021_09000 [Candidatus Dependentiae bacterium Noda2021]
MKTLSVLLCAFNSILCASAVHCAGVTWKTASDIGFEIRNHDTYPIRVYVGLLGEQDTKFVVTTLFDEGVVAARQGNVIKNLQIPLDINSGVFAIVIEYQNPITKKTYVNSYTIAPGKTMFLAWENKKLRPQQGKGIFQPVTQSGLSLAKNITQKDIHFFAQKTL